MKNELSIGDYALQLHESGLTPEEIKSACYSVTKHRERQGKKGKK